MGQKVHRTRYGDFPSKQPKHHDLEKYGSDRDSFDEDSSDAQSHHDPTYSSSSRETSGSYEPMLRKSLSRAEPRKVGFYRPPSRKTIRYLCLALTTTLVIFILSLVRASWVSSRQLQLGQVEKQAAQPPPWEDFPFLKRYFGGIRNLVPRSQNEPEYPSDVEPAHAIDNRSTSRVRDDHKVPTSVPFDPYEDAFSNKGDKHFVDRVACYLNEEETVAIPRVHYYEGVPKGLPDAVIGSYNVLDMRDDICFDRYGRLAPYGYGYSTKRGGTGAGLEGERGGADDMWYEDGRVPEVDFRNVKWHDAQRKCFDKNRHRFQREKNDTRSLEHLFLNMDDQDHQQAGKEGSLRKRADADASNDQTISGAQQDEEQGVELLNRTAVVIRTWWNREYTVEDIIYLRSLIAELSLLSGGEYTVHILVHVKDDNVPIWGDRQIYERVLENSLPEEFRGMGVLWSERQMNLIYGGLEESFFRDLPVHGVYRGAFMALQYFAHQHPEYDFFWNWEMDVRNTGHWYHLFEKVRQWTQSQPRKGLWERNGRFYIPSVHGSWEDFKQMVRVQSELGTESPNNIWSGLKGVGADIPGLPQGKTDAPVWGPESPQDMLQAQDDPIPPTKADRDRYEWGVGEEADLITFSPLFDPDGTTWFYTADVTGYNVTEGLPPRRASIGTSTRMSRRLLQTMHRETILEKHHMFSEMWPGSIALHHGYKAVYAPHPVYIDRRWPTAYLAGVMNAGRNGASGGARTSVYGGREHNFKGQSWFYDAGFSPNLWRRWLGYKVDNDGGEQEEKAGEGRMCLPAVMLHPVKDVNMLVEGPKIPEEQDMEQLDESGSDWDNMT